MCFGATTLGAGAKTRLESSIKKFIPHLIYNLCVFFFPGRVEADDDDDAAASAKQTPKAQKERRDSKRGQAKKDGDTVTLRTRVCLL